MSRYVADASIAVKWYVPFMLTPPHACSTRLTNFTHQI
jgi:hypothetical protein